MCSCRPRDHLCHVFKTSTGAPACAAPSELYVNASECHSLDPRRCSRSVLWTAYAQLPCAWAGPPQWHSLLTFSVLQATRSPTRAMLASAVYQNSGRRWSERNSLEAAVEGRSPTPYCCRSGRSSCGPVVRNLKDRGGATSSPHRGDAAVVWLAECLGISLRGRAAGCRGGRTSSGAQCGTCCCGRQACTSAEGNARRRMYPCQRPREARHQYSTLWKCLWPRCLTGRSHCVCARQFFQ